MEEAYIILTSRPDDPARITALGFINDKLSYLLCWPDGSTGHVDVAKVGDYRIVPADSLSAKERWY